MFKLTLRQSTFLLFFLIILIACNEEPTEPTNGVDGLNGFNALVDVRDEPAGDNCSSGGVRISVGQDSNENGTLDESEISSVSFVCNGGDGNDGSNGQNGTSLVARTSPENPGNNCESGGTLVEIGSDTNSNNSLDDNEVQSTFYVCNGSDGADGGENGANGLTSLIRVSNSTSCANGGLTIEVGLDDNDNGELDNGEINASYELCNGIDGTNGSNGSDGLSTLINVTSEGSGENCTNGGLLIVVGIDDNNDNVLDAAEVDATAYVCNGSDGTDGNDGSNGTSSITRVTTESAGVNCANGGLKIEIGMDDVTQDGTLQNEEVDYTYLVCNGLDGADGSNGSDGADGISTFIRTTTEPDGTNCANGGVKIELGLDANGNQIFDSGEEYGSPIYVCNGQNGSNGSDGADGKSVIVTSAPAGAACSNGGTTLTFGYDNNNDGDLADGGDQILTSYSVCNGLNGSNGNDGNDGANTIISTSTENPGANCANGGLEFQVGLDLNGNNSIDTGEEVGTYYVCNGADGSNGSDGSDGQSVFVENTASASCGTAGGRRLRFGYDMNNDGDIVDGGDVILATVHVCNGNDGSDGDSDNIFEFYFSNGFNTYADAIDVSIDNRGNNEYGSLLSVNSSVENDSTHSILYFPKIMDIINNEVEGSSFEVVEAILYLRAAVPSEKGSPPNSENWVGVKTLTSDAPLVEDNNADWVTSNGNDPWMSPGAAETESKGANEFSDMYRLPKGFYFNGTVPFLLNRTEITSWATNEDTNKGMVVVMLDRVNYEIDFYSSDYPDDKYFRPTLYIKVKTGIKGRTTSLSDKEYKARWNSLTYKDKLDPLKRRKRD